MKLTLKMKLSSTGVRGNHKRRNVLKTKNQTPNIVATEATYFFGLAGYVREELSTGVIVDFVEHSHRDEYWSDVDRIYGIYLKYSEVAILRDTPWGRAFVESDGSIYAYHPDSIRDVFKEAKKMLPSKTPHILTKYGLVVITQLPEGILMEFNDGTQIHKWMLGSCGVLSPVQ